MPISDDECHKSEETSKLPTIDELHHQPTVIVVIGMAGSGKTTLMKALYSHFTKPAVTTSLDDSANLNLNEDPTADSTETSKKTDATATSSSSSSNTAAIVRPKQRTYVVNLDPAVQTTPYPVNIDIRDTIKYKEVMKQYKLGPNGAIMTSLNLFATRFDQVHALLNKRAPQLDVVLIDTPGQIEVFNWSASGSIILDTLAIAFPTIVLYVVDTARCRSPITFMSNMMYACGVLYKTKLPFLMCFNKIDVRSPEQCFRWLNNYDEYADEVLTEDTYMASLSRSCALVMNEFYSGIRSVGVSAATTVGLEKLEAHIKASRNEYFEQYLPWLQEQRDTVHQRRVRLAQQAAEKFSHDLQNKGTLKEEDESDNSPREVQQQKLRNIIQKPEGIP